MKHVARIRRDRERRSAALLARDDKRRGEGEQWKQRVRFDEPREITRGVDWNHRQAEQLPELAVTRSKRTSVQPLFSHSTNSANGSAAAVNRVTFLIPNPQSLIQSRIPNPCTRSLRPERAAASSAGRAEPVRSRFPRACSAGEAAQRTSPSTVRPSSRRSSAGRPDRALPGWKR